MDYLERKYVSFHVTCCIRLVLLLYTLLMSVRMFLFDRWSGLCLQCEICTMLFYGVNDLQTHYLILLYSTSSNYSIIRGACIYD